MCYIHNIIELVPTISLRIAPVKDINECICVSVRMCYIHNIIDLQQRVGGGVYQHIWDGVLLVIQIICNRDWWRHLSLNNMGVVTVPQGKMRQINIYIRNFMLQCVLCSVAYNTSYNSSLKSFKSKRLHHLLPIIFCLIFYITLKSWG